MPLSMSDIDFMTMSAGGESADDNNWSRLNWAGGQAAGAAIYFSCWINSTQTTLSDSESKIGPNVSRRLLCAPLLK